MKYTTEKYSELLDGRLPCSTLEFELCDKLIDLKRELANNTEIIGSVSGCLSISKGIEICQRWERHLTDNEEDIGHIPTQEEVVKEALKNCR